MAEPIRVKGFEKKKSDPPPAPVVPLSSATDQAAPVVFKRRAPDPPPVKEVAPPPVEEEAPVEVFDGAAIAPYEDTPAEEFDGAPVESWEESAVEQPIAAPPPDEPRAVASVGARQRFQPQVAPIGDVAAVADRGTRPYVPDTDEMRVWKRQNWKWTLYEKSGLRQDEAPGKEA